MVRAVANKAAAIEMGSWLTDFIDPIEVCREKIELESTHYVGVFAYRRGWSPPVLKGKSITEAEFDWACEYKKTSAVLLPQTATKFDVELRRRAATQTPEEKRAQDAFLERIRGLATAMPFEDLADLEGRISGIVALWSVGGIRSMAAKSNVSPDAFRQLKLVEDKLIELGRRDQLKKFEDALDTIRLSAPEAGCFVIHGRGGGFGYKEISTRLIRKLEETAVELKSCRIDIRPDWRQENVQALIEIVALELNLDLASNSVETLAAQLKKLLEVSDVVLEFADLQRLEGSLPKFVEDFWKPLVNALPASLGHRFIGLLSFEQTPQPEWNSFLYQFGAEIYDPQNLILLPELTNFNEDEIFLWLRDRNMEAVAARAWAQTWMTETNGHPTILYGKIKSSALIEQISG